MGQGTKHFSNIKQPITVPDICGGLTTSGIIDKTVIYSLTRISKVFKQGALTTPLSSIRSPITGCIV